MKTVYITGCDRGLGLALAGTFVDEGFKVFAGSYIPDWPELKELKNTAGKQLYILPLDVTSDVSVQHAAEEIKRISPRLDVLINNAGIYTDQDGDAFEGFDFDAIRRMHETNTLGPLRVSQSVLPLLMRGDNKLLVNISSEAGSITDCKREKEYGYTMSKAALNMQSVVLQNQLKRFGIKVLAIHPGYVRSYMLGRFNTEATVEAADSARGIVQQLFQQALLDGPIFIDYQGQRLDW
ncbi:SDR family NAD(P)-dependent oxidoreductase [Bacillus sp. ISL-39]|uniref:SDR family NAD(P)-dependent oxidoreductase n=1 Tax=Bacillus sp. ISL-39 TaxID=2819124 RepID=UPI001BE63EA3|nr:SDR family NAD(P)-dependent oxidoreductase [Bacillus sp. ISL-39]